jgi:hypothetical protein
MNRLAILFVLLLSYGQIQHGDVVFVDVDNMTIIDSCPFVLHISNKSPYASYENATKSSVVAVKFGCVQRELESYSISKEYDVEKLRSPVMSGWSTAYLAQDINAKATQCVKLKSKLGIIRVEFSDGGVWHVVSRQKTAASGGHRGRP